MTDKTLRMRDGIVGAAVALCVVLGFKVNPAWFWAAGAIGVLLMASACFGVCFLYSFLGGQCHLKQPPKSS